MSVKEWDGKSLILDVGKGTVEQVIMKSFEEMRYVEAFTLLHSWIDYLMWEMETDELLKFKDQFYKIRFKKSVRRIREREIISQTESNRLIDFDDKRDIVVHRIIFNTCARIDSDESFQAIKITKKDAED